MTTRPLLCPCCGKPWHAPKAPAQAAPKKPIRSRAKAASGRPAVTPPRPAKGPHGQAQAILGPPFRRLPKALPCGAWR